MKSRCLAALLALLALMPDRAGSQDAASRRKDLMLGITAQTPAPEMFRRAYEVFSHPRCANCHPRDDRPRWDARTNRVHGMNVQRGDEQPPGNEQRKAGGWGRPGLGCPTCHQDHNGAAAGSPPGAADWRLAPKHMGWIGLTAAELCAQFKQQSGPDGMPVLDHILTSVDPLVAWAWDPGPGREAPPGNLLDFAQLLKMWNDKISKDPGPACPSE
jgi:hypothetical protein